MWMCLNDAFFSIVRTGDLPEGHLLVRARRQGDLERYFPNAEVQRTPGRDYLFRAVIQATQVAAVMAETVEAIDYGNFKDSVRDNNLHEAYFKVWSAMHDLQENTPYPRGDRRR